MKLTSRINKYKISKSRMKGETMKINTNNIVQQAKKYALLVGTIFISITCGYMVFSNEKVTYKEVKPVIVNETNKVQRVQIQISQEDIIKKNKVIVEKIEAVKEEIPFNIEAVGESSRTTKTKTITEGKNGTKELTYKVRYEDNVEVSRVLIQEKITKQPVGKVIQHVSTSTTSRDGTNIDRKDIIAPTLTSNYTKVIDMKYTVYCLCVKCCGKTPASRGYGVTASGLKLVPGQNQRAIAVDTSVIKLGTKVYVENANGTVDYGYATAADTGSGIKGNRIDLYVDNHANSAWGSTGNVKVYILE